MATIVERALMASVLGEMPVPVVDEVGRILVALNGTVMPLRVFVGIMASAVNGGNGSSGDYQRNVVNDEIYLLWREYPPAPLKQKMDPLSACADLVNGLLTIIKKEQDPLTAFRSLIREFDAEYAHAMDS